MAFILLACACLPASAALLDGQTVDATYLFPDESTVFAGPVRFVVGAGLEVANFAGLVDIDVSDKNLTMTLTRDANVNNVAFDGIRFDDVNDTIPSFSSVALNPATSYAGFDASRVVFSQNSMFVNLAGLPGLRGQTISIDFDGGNSVPEPGTAGLIASSVLATGAALARRRARS